MENRIDTTYTTSLTIIIALGSMNAGYQAGVINSMGETFQFMYSWTENQRDSYMNIASSILTVFATIAALCGSIIIKTLGRRGMMFTGNLLSLIGCAILCIQSPIALIVGRAIMGIMMGTFFYLCPLYIRESVPAVYGGFYGSFHQLMIVVGVGLAYSLSLLLPAEDQLLKGTHACWREILCVPILISGIQFLLMNTMFKMNTPKSLYMCKQEGQCKLALSKMYYKEEDITNAMADYKIQYEKSQNSNFAQIFTSTKNIVVICCFMAIFQQMTGINSLTYFSTNIFNEVLKSHSKATVATAILGAIQIIFTFVSLFIVDRVGRKLLLIVGSVLCAIGEASFGYFYRPGEELPMWKEISCVASMGFIFIAFSLTHGPVCWTYLGEVMHEKTLPMAVASNLLFNVITVAWTIPLVKILKAWLFYMYAIMMIICMVFCMVYVKETKGLTDTEIQNAYSNKSSSLKSKADTDSELKLISNEAK